MCVVSAVLDYGRNHIPLNDWTLPAWNEFQQILRRLEELDKKLGQPECHDPAKAKWMKSVEARLRRLEAKRVKKTKKASA